MDEADGKLEELKTKQQAIIADMKKSQAESFQKFKKTAQEEAEAFKAKNLKALEAFKSNAKKEIEALIQKQSEETEAFTSGPFKEFAETTRAQLEKEAQEAGKEMNEETKAEIEAKFKEALKKKDQEFDLKHLEQLFAMKEKFLEEEEKLHREIQASVKEFQTQQLEVEHKVLKDNLVALQDTLEKFHDEQFDVKKNHLAPVSNNVMLDKFREAVHQIIAERQKEVEAKKDKAKTEFEEKVKKIEEEMERPSTPTVATPTDPKEDKKKDFLMKKFSNLQANSPATPSTPTEEAPKQRQVDSEREAFMNHIRELEKELEDFKLEKAKLIDEQKCKVEGKSNSQLEEHKTAKDGLQQVHRARLDKLAQFQKNEKEALLQKLADLDKQLDEKWALEKQKLKQLESEEKDTIVHTA